jgi:hypothetical protein
MTFRTKRDAEDWARRTEDEMIRGVYVRRSSSEKMLLQDALKRYLKVSAQESTSILPAFPRAPDSHYLLSHSTGDAQCPQNPPHKHYPNNGTST